MYKFIMWINISIERDLRCGWHGINDEFREREVADEGKGSNL